MSITFTDSAERLVPISDFNQGRTGKIFSGVAENNNEYTILKNNQSTAVLLSVKEYKAMQEKLAKMDRLLECVENTRLLQIVKDRASDNSIPFKDLVMEDGLTMEEVRGFARSAEPD